MVPEITALHPYRDLFSLRLLKLVMRHTRSVPLSGPVKGFTLIELVVVMILAGVLAAVAVPRFIGVQAWSTRGYLDGARSALEYARQTAVAQRRWVCVTVAASGLTLTRARKAFDDDAAPCATTQSLLLPGNGLNTLATPTGVSLSLLGGATSPVVFNGQGQSIDSTGAVRTVQLQVTGDQVFTLTIEGSSGYVH